MNRELQAILRPYRDYLRAADRRYANLARIAFEGCIVLPACSVKAAELRTLHRGAP